MESIDRITLELMTNRAHYKKYIANTDPIKHQESQDYLRNLEKFRGRILIATQDYLSDPDTSFNLEVNEAFQQFTKTMIRYFEMKELEESGETRFKIHREDCEDEYDNEEDETLFGNIETIARSAADKWQSNTTKFADNQTSSFWGKDRVKKER